MARFSDKRAQQRRCKEAVERLGGPPGPIVTDAGVYTSPGHYTAPDGWWSTTGCYPTRKERRALRSKKKGPTCHVEQDS